MVLLPRELAMLLCSIENNEPASLRYTDGGKIDIPAHLYRLHKVTCTKT